MELSRFSNDLLFELFGIHVPCWFDEQRWRWTSGPNNYAFFDQVTAGQADIVFDGSMTQDITVSSLSLGKGT